jgi:hypothetical protein
MVLADHGRVGSMGRRGAPYDNAQADSFRKTLKVEGVYPMAFEAFADVAAELPHFIEQVYNASRLHSAFGSLSPLRFEEQHAPHIVETAAGPCHPQAPPPDRRPVTHPPAASHERRSGGRCRAAGWESEAASASSQA